jgi:hypothetical protein
LSEASADWLRKKGLGVDNSLELQRPIISLRSGPAQCLELSDRRTYCLGVFYGTFQLSSARLGLSELVADGIANAGRSHGDSRNSRKRDNGSGYGLLILW